MEKIKDLAANLKNLCTLIQSVGESTKKELDKIISSNDILTDKAMATASIAEDITVDDRPGIEILIESIEEARQALGKIGPVHCMEPGEHTQINAADILLEQALISICKREDKDSLD